MKGKSLEKFEDWSDRNGIHLNRHLSLIDKQSDIFAHYVEVVKAYPANSSEFASEITRLHQSIISLLDEMKETMDSFAQDCSDFQDILMTFKGEILEIYANQK